MPRAIFQMCIFPNALVMVLFQSLRSAHYDSPISAYDKLVKTSFPMNGVCNIIASAGSHGSSIRANYTTARIYCKPFPPLSSLQGWQCFGNAGQNSIPRGEMEYSASETESNSISFLLVRLTSYNWLLLEDILACSWPLNSLKTLCMW